MKYIDVMHRDMYAMNKLALCELQQDNNEI